MDLIFTLALSTKDPDSSHQTLTESEMLGFVFLFKGTDHNFGPT